MIYFTKYEILFSIYSSALVGMFFGFIYTSSMEILGYIKKYLLMPFQCAKNGANFKFKRIFTISFEKNNTKIGRLSKNIYEFIIFTIFGCLTIILTYLVLDGVFRLYILVIIAIFFLLSKQTLGKLSGRILNFIFSSIYFIFSLVISLALIPIAKLYMLFARKTKMIINLISYKLSISNSNKLIKKKREEIKRKINE